MNGSLALHVALALHGNAWLADPVGAPPALEASRSTFQYARSFSADGTTSTGAWFAHLRAEGVRRLELACSEPRSAFDVGRTAFAGVDPWALVSATPARVWSGTLTHVEGETRAAVGGRAERGSLARAAARRAHGVGPPGASGPPLATPSPAGGSAHRGDAGGLGGDRGRADHRWNSWSAWFGQAGCSWRARRRGRGSTRTWRPTVRSTWSAAAAGGRGRRVGVRRHGLVERRVAAGRGGAGGVRAGDRRALPGVHHRAHGRRQRLTDSPGDVPDRSAGGARAGLRRDDRVRRLARSARRGGRGDHRGGAHGDGRRHQRPGAGHAGAGPTRPGCGCCRRAW